MDNNINDRFVQLQVRAKEVDRFIKGSKLPFPYDLENMIFEILNNAISTCHTILTGTKNTIVDLQDKLTEQEQK